MTQRKDGIPPMRITEAEARRWDMRYDPQRAGLVMIAEEIARRRNTEIKTPDLKLDPDVEELVSQYNYWHAIETDAVNMKKEIAIRLMEYRFISITKLAEELRISRPTLYAWKEEADAAAQPIPEFGRRRDEPPRT